MNGMFEIILFNFRGHLTRGLQDDSNRFQMSVPIVRINSETVERHAVAFAGSLRKLIGPMTVRPGTGSENFHMVAVVAQCPSGRAQRRLRPAHEVNSEAKSDDGDSQLRCRSGTERIRRGDAGTRRHGEGRFLSVSQRLRVSASSPILFYK